MDTLPALPSELQDEILQFAASQSADTANTLRRVSKGVALRIEPILYEVVTTDDRKFTARKFQPALIETDPVRILDLFQRHGCHIHCLWLSPSGPVKEDQAISILKLCPSLKNLVISFTCSIEILKTVQEHLPNLERLSGTFVICHTAFDVSKPAYKHLTHLDVGGLYGWKVLSTFLPNVPNLTHLAIDDMGLSDEVVAGALQHCKKLRALLLVDIEEETGIRYCDVVDTRIVRLTAPPLKDWLAGVIGGRDMWTLADEVISDRGRGM